MDDSEQKQDTPGTTGEPTERVDRYGMRLLPPDHPFYKRGWIVGATVLGALPNQSRKNKPAESPPQENPKKD